MPQTQPVTTIGIDVGGERKGFHLVFYIGKQMRDKAHIKDVIEARNWCLERRPRAIGIDAPCRWSLDGKARPAEQELMKQGIFCFSTPTREAALLRTFYKWMLGGEELYQALLPEYPLLQSAQELPATFCFETFPHAIEFQLGYTKERIQNKKARRRACLASADFWNEELSSIDYIDAALCAMMGNIICSNGSAEAPGDKETGRIFIPGKGYA